jgi:broad-specificity NMP kinase
MIEIESQDIQFNVDKEHPERAIEQLIQIIKQQSDKMKQLNRRITDIEDWFLN